jgi:rod shape determining protein RodA
MKIRTTWEESNFLHVDKPLFIALLLLASLGLIVLYSAGNQDINVVLKQGIRLLIGLSVMLFLAQIRPQYIEGWVPWLYLVGLALLILVLLIGDIVKGSQRWINLGLFRFQPSELMKLAVPMMVSWFLANRPLPPNLWRLSIAGIIIVIPVLLIGKQPDLGTAVIIASSGIFVLFLSGVAWRLIISFITLGATCLPILWYFMHDYQRQRVLTLINPEADPLGTGYHTIQAKIAIGSGGLYGKGWLNGTQSYLEFLPERSTDFIFAVYSEEFGLLGVILLIIIYTAILTRGMVIAAQAQDIFSRLLAGSVTLTFFVYIFVNMGMVSGILPVVGLPLPLISYGGTSLVTMMAGFGLLMSIHTHRRLLSD